ncbi:MAG: peptidase domain-containing ABC transporter [Bacteroidota bacterium]
MGIKIKQHDITDCGAACLASISAHYKLKLPIARIRQIAGTDKKGTNLYGMIQAAEKLGYVAKGVRGNLEALQEIPLPAIAHIIVKNQLQHYVVVYKVTKDYVQVMDPGYGKIQKIPMDKWEEEWTGILMLIAPGEHFQTGNQKVSVIQRFWALLKPHKTILFQALFGAIVYTMLGLTTSIYIQKITDFVLIDGNTNLLNLLSIVMIGLLLLQIFIGAMKSIFVIKTGQKIDAQLILGYYKHLLRLPQTFFDNMRVGEILSRIGDAVKIRAFINDVAINLLVNIFIVIFSFVLMFTYYWKLAVIMAIIIPLYVLIYVITNKLNKKRERDLMEKAADLETQLVESLNSVKTIKQFGLERFANVKTENRFVRLLGATYQSGMNSLFSANSSEMVSRVFTIILLWCGSYFVINQAITPGELLSFYAIIGYFTGPAMGLIGMNKTIQNALIAADRLFEIIDLEREDDEQKFDLTTDLLGDIHFKNVQFTYGTRKEVFKDLSLTIQKGKVTAIVGESGSGKSTLVGILQKLYPISDGHISIGDYNLQYISNQSLRQLVGVVPQQLDLFAGNVLENIAIGEPEPDIRRIVDICAQLGLIQFIEGLPRGFETYIGENGATLSGGQKQRLAIARALYRDPDILILDEATSSLDSTSEAYVQNTIKALRDAGKTIIIIAHRLSTVMDADKIVVLQEGELIEAGTHHELLAAHGKYFELWEKQFPVHVRYQLNGKVVA